VLRLDARLAPGLKQFLQSFVSEAADHRTECILYNKGCQMSSSQDVNGEGRLDLVVQITTSALQLTVTDTLTVLKGKTNGGVSIKGTDTVKVVP
jgi:hypothetical protein